MIIISGWSLLYWDMIWSGFLETITFSSVSLGSRFWETDLLFLISQSTMNCAGLAAQWEGDPDIRTHVRQSNQILKYPVGAKFCEPTRNNCVLNSAVLSPILAKLSQTPNFKLPPLDPLQVELAKLVEKVGATLGEKGVYAPAIELKKLASFIKRKARRKEVTKEMGQLIGQQHRRINQWYSDSYSKNEITSVAINQRLFPFSIGSCVQDTWSVNGAWFHSRPSNDMLRLALQRIISWHCIPCQDVRFHALLLLLDPSLKEYGLKLSTYKPFSTSIHQPTVGIIKITQPDLSNLSFTWW